MRRADGCVGALIMGADGIAVEKVWQAASITEVDLEASAAEFASLVKNARNANSGLRLGRLREMTLTGESCIFILRFVNEDYFVAMVLSPDGNFGRARYELGRAELLLEKELAA
jgi:predicted regulator of Ras-like GTPase activity (Roadblock/LC7/MglB family)